MSELFLYLLKANLSLLLFFLAYRLAFRRLTFYTLNRIFLVFGLIFSAVYPLVDVSAYFHQHERMAVDLVGAVQRVNFTAGLQLAKQFAPAAAEYNYWELAEVVFWTGVGLMGVRLLIQLISVYRMHQLSILSQRDGLKYRKVNGQVNPFSFWRTVYLNPELHNEEELAGILKHEYVHVQQMHTIDVLMAEFAVIFYWFNPAAWLIKQSIKENLEFVTDQKLLENGTDIKRYQYSLIRIGNLPQHATLVNNFNFLTIKKRIAMMNQKRSPKKQVSRYVLLMPVLITALFIFTVSHAQTENGGLLAYAKKVIPAGTTNTNLVNPTAASSENVGAVSRSNRQKVSGNINGITAKAVQDTTNKFKADSALIFIDSKEVDKKIYSKLDPMDIHSMTILEKEDALKRYGAKGKYGAVLIITKKYAAEMKQVEVPISEKQIKSAAIEQVEVPVVLKNSMNSILQKEGITTSPAPLVIIDGKESTWNRLADIPKDNISAFTVLKKSTAAALYKDKGKNGVLLVTTRKPGSGRGATWTYEDGDKNSSTLKTYLINDLSIDKG